MTTPDVLPDSPIVPVPPPIAPRTGLTLAVMVLAVRDERTVPAALVAGYTDVLHDGAELEPERGIYPAVAVPLRIANAPAVE